MAHSSKLKIEIIQRLELFPISKLRKVLSYIRNLDSDVEKNRKDRILSYAGSWKNLDIDVFNDLTQNLNSIRAADIRDFENE